ncbi:chromosome segregation protein SMC [Virgibacillus sp. YIM 98842]|uniref:chromosome segregation protein SMC n=1 Tax=Virgibacillus sp. YIM 98842 TaxID=2663533 RepID=UPI0013DAA1D3|nr:chromosome segregation protein SMC [Virgibacillus sp. YIM 98842]
MYLKQLESVGFKSFAERIRVDFVPGVTAVVGPNGSGKSNITDAIRWVLGEQSAKSLRGSKMEDIIFQGSDSRKPLNVAEVTLTLDNQDGNLAVNYAEVSVTRRVYRSGESEFFINKQPCRLKDIVDLFMDSGMGREAFSIISQGKVEEILSSKAEERRTIFEEAAGVLKYKQRKKKAEYKLEETQENLNRVEDIIYEIEQQRAPLEQQAETAARYLDLKDKLKEQEIALLIAEIELLHHEWKTLLDELEEEKMEEMNWKSKIQRKDSNLENERNEIQKLDDEIAVLQSKLVTITEELEKSEGKKNLFNERTKHITENREKLQSQQQESAAKIEKLQHVIKEENQKLSHLKEGKTESQKKVKELEKMLSLREDEISDEIENLKSEYIEQLNQQAAMRNEKQSVIQQIDQLKAKRDSNRRKFNELLLSKENLTKKEARVKEYVEKQEALLSDKESDVIRLKEELDEKRELYQTAQAKLYEGYQYIEKLSARKEMLKELKDDFHGYFQGVKAVLKARDEKQLNHIYGAVIELIDVPKAYLSAIETTLGGQAQHIIVNNDETARKAISWLKKTNNGRATFLPLVSLQERRIPGNIISQVEGHPGFIGIASELVQTNSLYKKAMNHLAGNVIIAKSLKDANHIAKIVMRKYRIVTLDGDVVSPGGAMSGGARKKSNQSSLFTREKDLTEITEKLTDYKRNIHSFEEKLKTRETKISELDHLLKAEEANIPPLEQELQEMRSNYADIRMKKESLMENIKLYEQEKNQFEEESEQLTGRDQALSNNLKEMKHTLASIEENIERLSNQEEEFKKNYEQLQHDFHKEQVTLAELDERLKAQQEKTDANQAQLNELNMQYQKYTNDLEELKTIHEKEETIEEIEERISLKKNEKQDLTYSIQDKRSQRAERSQLLQDQERELKEENKNHQAFQKKIQQKEVKTNRLDVDLENRLSHLQTEYTMTFEKAQLTYTKAEDMEAAKINVNDLKQRIEQLGTVNLGAIEEYERIKERLAFLIEQKTDLVEAKETLYAIIAEMDEEMEKRFDETFTQIKEEFKNVFYQLFGGGHAELKLTDPSKLLDTGVEIIAQPPGKKLQHLGLLSGGERALTAIALLFSILRVRPVPFCVLDEVEAALDEANVVRFAEYVKFHSEDTQFIVITHRKGTMEEADVLYGVTMQEAGVSRLVSVRLEDTKELIG